MNVANNLRYTILQELVYPSLTDPVNLSILVMRHEGDVKATAQKIIIKPSPELLQLIVKYILNTWKIIKRDVFLSKLETTPKQTKPRTQNISSISLSVLWLSLFIHLDYRILHSIIISWLFSLPLPFFSLMSWKTGLSAWRGMYTSALESRASSRMQSLYYTPQTESDSVLFRFLESLTA